MNTIKIAIAAALMAIVVTAAVLVHNKIYNEGFAAHKKLADAQKAKEILAATVARDKALARSAELSAKLLAQEGKVVYVTKEVIKYVPQFTTGKPCLSADAVSMLNNRADDNPETETRSEPAPQGSAAPSATDTDVAYWVAEANGLYSTCAARLNALIEYETRD